MVRSVLPYVLLPYVSVGESSLMQRSGQGSRAVQMQKTAEDMEEFYRSMLEQAVKSQSLDEQNPVVTNKGYLDKVEEQFGLLEDELKTEKGLNQKLVTDTRQTVVSCNAARGAGFAGENGAVSLMGKMTEARNTHRTCRGNENTFITQMESNCAKFQSATKCSNDQEWYDSDTFQHVVDTAVVCKQNVSAVGSKAAECDVKQGLFEKKFCVYSSTLETVCSVYDTCYSASESAYNVVEADVKEIEDSQKLVWLILQRVRCYIDALETVDATSKPTEDMITNCKAGDYSAAVLSISYLDLPPRQLCLTHADVVEEPTSVKPGAGGWEDKEYSEDLFQSHDKLSDPSACDSEVANGGGALLQRKAKNALVEVHSQLNFAKVGDWITCGHNIGDELGEQGKMTLETCSEAAADAGCTAFAFKDGSRTGLKDFGEAAPTPDWTCRCSAAKPDLKEHDQMLALAEMPSWNKRTPEAWPACKDGWEVSKSGFSFWVQKK